MANQLGFYYNIDDCIGCKTCIMACKDTHDLPVGTKYRRVIEYAGGTWSDKDGVPTLEGFFAYHIPTACNHCERPLCVANCPTGAMTKRDEDGVVYSDPETCIGCGTCVESCPYDVPQVREETGVCGKCDFCKDLMEQGEDPACVASCLGRCIKFGDIDELRAQYGDNADIKPLASSSETGPCMVINRHRLNPDDVEGTIVSPVEEL
ncbi:DMSO/selenate family reductase complex B subunit [Adlercreutzia sp. R21]|uniref:DMSO/selenate family reductase complex B subunit n=1 Tax=Adlercreutzia wanghongyangiae TaxID=3111451 RepID=A0ABU6IJW8_9ACTN|nr:DMSO/selenate family reductase complex B subunit [Adlercreutzia sp. R21]MEC4176761.1 DMSO/selenate family reductase complex B subunit [Adlercreutzia sp. R7]MEC4184685.1 DMSO/selenate family reductase complex B subunit [Adlercreutzia sp. R21]